MVMKYNEEGGKKDKCPRITQRNQDRKSVKEEYVREWIRDKEAIRY